MIRPFDCPVSACTCVNAECTENRCLLEEVKAQVKMDEDNFKFTITERDGSHRFEMENGVLSIDDVEYEAEASPEIYALARGWFRVVVKKGE